MRDRDHIPASQRDLQEMRANREQQNRMYELLTQRSKPRWRSRLRLWGRHA